MSNQKYLNRIQQINHFDRNSNKALRATASVNYTLALDIINKFGKHGIKAIQLYLLFKLHDGSFINYSPNAIAENSLYSKETISDKIEEFERMGIIEIYRNKEINRRTIRYISKRNISKKYVVETASKRFQRDYITFDKENILSELFPQMFFSVLFKHMAENNIQCDMNKTFYKYTRTLNEYDNLTTSQQQKIRKQFINSLETKRFKDEKTIKEYSNQNKIARIYQPAESLQNVLESKYNRRTPHLSLALTYMGEIFGKSKQTAANWYKFLTDNDLIRKTKVVWVFNMSEHKDILASINWTDYYDNIYPRINIYNDRVEIQVDDYLEFPNFETIIVKKISNRKIKASTGSLGTFR